MAEGKIVPDRIGGVDRAKGSGDFGRHLPVWRAIAGQSETSSQANHMRIERNDEPGRGHQCPCSKVNFVTPNHPAEKQIEPLARAAGRWSREEVTDTRPLRHSAVSRTKIHVQCASGKRIERGADIRSFYIVACNEEALDRARFAEHSLQDEQQRDQIATSNPSVDDRIDGRSIALGVEVPHEAGRMRAHGCKERLDRVQDACDPAERERRGAEADDFAVLRRSVAPDDMNWIGCRVDVIECLVQILEPRGELALRIPNPPRLRSGQAESRIPAGNVISETA